MKNGFLCLLLFLSYSSNAQYSDSLVIKYVDSLIKVSRGYTDRREFGKALEVNSIATGISIEKFGNESHIYGLCCFNLGRISYFKEDYSESEKWLLKSKGIILSAVGTKHLDYVKTINSLAVLYDDLRNYDNSEKMHLEAISILEQNYTKEHPRYAQSLNNLAIVYMHMGKYREAEALDLEALKIREKILGRNNEDFAHNLLVLGELYKDMGDYNKAEHYYRESLKIREKLFGKEHGLYAENITALGELYSILGNYNKSELLLEEGKLIREKVYGKKSTQYAASLQKLALLYIQKKEFNKSEFYFLEALAIKENTLGKEHPDYAAYLEGFSGLYREMGKLETALALLKDAGQTYAKYFVKEQAHRNYARCLNKQGVVYMFMRDYIHAEKCFAESTHINLEKSGTNSKAYLSNITNLAFLYTYKEEYEKAQRYFLESETLCQKFLINAISYLSESELQNYLLSISDIIAAHYSLAQKSTIRLPEFEMTCYNNSLFYKGFLLNSVSQVKNLANSNPSAAVKYNDLKSYRIRLAAEYSKSILERKNVQELEAKSNELEKELVSSFKEYGQIMHVVNWIDVKQKLNHSEAAIEFVKYNYYTPDKTDSVMYAALILTENSQQPVFIPLFEEKQLERLCRKNADVNIKLFYNQFYTGVPHSLQDLNREQQAGLFNLIWRPLLGELQNIKTIYYSPSGLLHRLNLSAIPINEKEVLSDKYDLIELGSTRNLVVGNYASADSISTSIKAKSDLHEAVIFGGIEYDMDSTEIFARNADSSNEVFASRNTTRGCSDDLKFNYVDTANRGGSWYYLKWTEKEISSIESILRSQKIKTRVRKSYAATEESFKSIGAGSASPRILHIATHGFFFPDSKEKVGSSQLAVGSEPVFKISDHPMIRSGLILAGGNHAWKTGKPFKEGMEDGILTAYEISQMNLSNTELVVLSACETGLGDIQGNEGVYGLQRAFKIAGAKYLIMSLWQVPDKQTKEFMETFYKRWLNDKLSIPDAFRKTQKEMQKKFVDPYSWAGFVMVK